MPASHMQGRRAARLLLLCLAASMMAPAAAQPQQQDNTPIDQRAISSSTTAASEAQPSFFFLPPFAPKSRCWAPGASPHLRMSIPGILAAKEASKGYADNPELLFDGLWTNAVNRDSTEDAVLRLRVMRNALAARNLHHPYLPGKLAGNIKSAAEVPCGQEARSTRTIDGSCNYLEDPLAGAAGTRFGRNVPLAAVQPDLPNLLHPNPLLVSAKLLQRPPRTEYSRVPFLNMWAGAWIQFATHDWFVHGTPDNSRPISVPMPPQHSLARVSSAMVVGSTRPDPTRTAEEAAAGLAPTSLNTATHWWDASQLYGSDATTSFRLREGVGGRMKLTPAGLLPLGARGSSDAGVDQNWWLGLEVMHTLFAKEHNAIAAQLAAAYPTMTDQQLFDKARMITAAVIAKIHTVEWTPAILPNNNLAAAMHGNWDGLISMLLPPEADVAAALTDNIFQDEKEGMFGFRGQPRNDWGTQYSLTEEFTSVYRMHMLLPDSFTVRGADGQQQERIWTGDTVHAGARAVMEKYPFKDLAATFGSTLPGTLTLHNYPLFMTNITLPHNLGALDLAAVDIIRDRERGVPRYNQFRRLLQLKPLPSIDAITTDPADRAALKSVYGDDIELVDLLPGVLAESQRPDCFGFGETQFQVFILMASRRLAADRFFTSDYTAASYTQVGLNWIEAASFRNVLLRNIPDLKASNVKIPPNAFNPWTLPTK